MTRTPPTVPCDRHRWHQDFYAGMGCRNCRATKRRRESPRVAACYCLALVAMIVGWLFVKAAKGAEPQAWHASAFARSAFDRSPEWYPFGVYRSREAALRDLRASAKRNRAKITAEVVPLGPVSDWFPPVEAPKP